MWVPGLVVFNDDSSIRISFPFDKDNTISPLEKEILTYFDHKNEYPQLTKDVAQYIIALMLRQKGEINDAMFELEELLSRYPDFSIINTPDYNASKKTNGHLIEFEPPHDITPMWRVQYSAIILLLQLYSQQNEKDKYLKLSSKLTTECSPNGWSWNINKIVGDLYVKNNLGKLAAEQYSVSINGIHAKTEIQTARMETLFENGYAIKPNNFVSWDSEINKKYSTIVFEIDSLRNKIK